MLLFFLRSFGTISSSPQISAILAAHFTGGNASLRQSPPQNFHNKCAETCQTTDSQTSLLSPPMHSESGVAEQGSHPPGCSRLRSLRPFSRTESSELSRGASPANLWRLPPTHLSRFPSARHFRREGEAEGSGRLLVSLTAPFHDHKCSIAFRVQRDN